MTDVYVANPDNDTVTRLFWDNTKVWETKVGDNPRTLAVEPDDDLWAPDRIWVANQGSGDISVLNRDGDLVRTIDLGYGAAPYGIVFAPDGRDRSNVAIQNMGASEEGAITLKTTVYSGEAADATARVLKNVKLRPGEFHQFNQVLDVLGSTANGYVKVERVEGTAPFYAYGVINDQANSDGSFIFPVTASSLEGTAGQTLPVIVETSAFTSELTVTNFSEEPRTLDFQFVAEGIETAGNAAVFSMRLEAGQQEIVAEVVEELRRQGVAGLGSTRGFYAGPVFATAAQAET